MPGPLDARQAFNRLATPAGGPFPVVTREALATDAELAPDATEADRLALHDRFDVDGQAGLSSDEFTALHAYQAGSGWGIPAFDAPAPTDTMDLNDALDAVTQATGVHEEAVAQAEQLDQQLAVELAKYGTALGPTGAEAYAARFRQDHEAAYKAVDVALAQMAGTLARHAGVVAELFSADPGRFTFQGQAIAARDQVLGAYQALAATPEHHAQAYAFAQTALAREPLAPGPAELALGYSPLDAQAIASTIAGPALATGYETAIGDGVASDAAFEELEAKTAALFPASALDDASTLRGVYDSMQQDLEGTARLLRGNLDDAVEAGSDLAGDALKLGAFGQRLAVVGLATMPFRFGAAALEGNYAEAAASLIDGAADGADLGSLFLKGSARFAGRVGLLDKLAPAFGAVANGLMAYRDWNDGKKAAAIGDAMMAVGSVGVLFGATAGVGALLIGLGMTVSLVAGLFGDDLDEAALDAEAARLRAAGVTGAGADPAHPERDVAHDISRSTEGQLRALHEQLGLSPEQVQGLSALGYGVSLVGSQAEGTMAQAGANMDALSRMFSDPATGQVDTASLMRFLDHLHRTYPDPTHQAEAFNVVMTAIAEIGGAHAHEPGHHEPLSWWLAQLEAFGTGSDPIYDRARGNLQGDENRHLLTAIALAGAWGP
jgi:hypothetical protein